MPAAITSTAPAPPCYRDTGWFHWPDHEDYSLGFLRVLAAAQEGASTISECFSAARSIKPGHDESWHDAWKALAEANGARGDAAFERGALNLAMSNWLRASHYYRAAEVFLDIGDPRHASLVRKMAMYSRLYLYHAGPGAGVVRIPYEDGKSLEGYFIPASGAHSLLPVVICFGGLDIFKDDLLYTMRRSAAANHLSLLLIDLPGFEAAGDGERLASRIDVEAPISRWLDYLLARGDVDPERIAIYGDGLGGSYATRAARKDHRFAAAVCDGGLWDRKERLFMMRRMVQRPGSGASRAAAWIAGDMIVDYNLKCPCLITIGQHDYIAADDARELYEASKRAGIQLELKVFSATETGAAPGQIDNPTLVKEFVFDWIRDKLRISQSAPAQLDLAELRQA